MGTDWRKVPPEQAALPNRRPRPLEDWDAAVLAMEIGDCIDSDAMAKTIRVRISGIKKRTPGWTRRYKVVQWTAYFSRIWRLA